MNSNRKNNIKSSSSYYHSRLNYVYTSRQCDEYLNYLEDLRRIIFGADYSSSSETMPTEVPASSSIRYHIPNGRTLVYKLENASNYGIKLSPVPSETETIKVETIEHEVLPEPEMCHHLPQKLCHQLPAQIEERMRDCLHSSAEIISGSFYGSYLTEEEATGRRGTPETFRFSNIHLNYKYQPIDLSSSESSLYSEDTANYREEVLSDDVSEEFLVREDFSTVLDDSESVFAGVEDHTEEVEDFVVSQEEVEDALSQLHGVVEVSKFSEEPAYFEPLSMSEKIEITHLSKPFISQKVDEEELSNSFIPPKLEKTIDTFIDDTTCFSQAIDQKLESSDSQDVPSIESASERFAEDDSGHRENIALLSFSSSALEATLEDTHLSKEGDKPVIDSSLASSLSLTEHRQIPLENMIRDYVQMVINAPKEIIPESREEGEEDLHAVARNSPVSHASHVQKEFEDDNEEAQTEKASDEGSKPCGVTQESILSTSEMQQEERDFSRHGNEETVETTIELEHVSEEYFHEEYFPRPFSPFTLRSLSSCYDEPETLLFYNYALDTFEDMSPKPNFSSEEPPVVVEQVMESPGEEDSEKDVIMYDARDEEESSVHEEQAPNDDESVLLEVINELLEAVENVPLSLSDNDSECDHDFPTDDPAEELEDLNVLNTEDSFETDVGPTVDIYESDDIEEFVLLQKDDAIMCELMKMDGDIMEAPLNTEPTTVPSPQKTIETEHVRPQFEQNTEAPTLADIRNQLDESGQATNNDAEFVSSPQRSRPNSFEKMSAERNELDEKSGETITVTTSFGNKEKTLTALGKMDVEECDVGDIVSTHAQLSEMTTNDYSSNPDDSLVNRTCSELKRAEECCAVEDTLFDEKKHDEMTSFGNSAKDQKKNDLPFYDDEFYQETSDLEESSSVTAMVLPETSTFASPMLRDHLEEFARTTSDVIVHDCFSILAVMSFPPQTDDEHGVEMDSDEEMSRPVTALYFSDGNADYVDYGSNEPTDEHLLLDKPKEPLDHETTCDTSKVQQELSEPINVLVNSENCGQSSEVQDQETTEVDMSQTQFSNLKGENDLHSNVMENVDAPILQEIKIFDTEDCVNLVERKCSIEANSVSDSLESKEQIDTSTLKNFEGQQPELTESVTSVAETCKEQYTETELSNDDISPSEISRQQSSLSGDFTETSSVASFVVQELIEDLLGNADAWDLSEESSSDGINSVGLSPRHSDRRSLISLLQNEMQERPANLFQEKTSSEINSSSSQPNIGIPVDTCPLSPAIPVCPDTVSIDYGTTAKASMEVSKQCLDAHSMKVVDGFNLNEVVEISEEPKAQMVVKKSNCMEENRNAEEHVSLASDNSDELVEDLLDNIPAQNNIHETDDSTGEIRSPEFQTSKPLLASNIPFTNSQSSSELRYWTTSLFVLSPIEEIEEYTVLPSPAPETPCFSRSLMAELLEIPKSVPLQQSLTDEKEEVADSTSLSTSEMFNRSDNASVIHNGASVISGHSDVHISKSGDARPHNAESVPTNVPQKEILLAPTETSLTASEHPETSSVAEEVSYFLTTACVAALAFVAPTSDSSSFNSDIIEDASKYFSDHREPKDHSAM